MIKGDVVNGEEVIDDIHCCCDLGKPTAVSGWQFDVQDDDGLQIIMDSKPI